MVARRYLFIIFLICLLAVMPISLLHAVEYGGLGGLPANPDPANPRTSSIFVYTLESGSSKQDAVKVINNSNQTKTIEVYATDSEIASGGSFACTQKADTNKEVGNWVKFTTSEVTLAPNSDQVVNFSIQVPDDVSVGEHNGCVVIQEKGIAAQDGGNGVQLSFRSALRVAITVPGEIKKEIAFSSLSVTRQANKYAIRAQLLNKGNVSLDTDVQVSVKNWLNRAVYQNGGVYPLLAQKQPMELNYEFGRPYWGGVFRISGYADYNGDPATPLGVAAAKNVRKPAPGSWLFVPPRPLAALIEVLGLVLLLALIILMIWRRRKRKSVSRKWETFTVDRGDTVMSLAKDFGTSWKAIVRVNKLRAPYELKPGTSIKLPSQRRTNSK